jgi:radical SAM superfamily enzyme YgiQ (UPF0313 family)
MGKPLVAGGPLFTTAHERFPEIRHFVLGEAENVIGQLIADMAAGTVRHTYKDPGKPDITTTPVPRWDLIRMKDYATMALQFSRGCPFDCEFCDIIVMYGRLPRVKTPAQMVRELDALLSHGRPETIFIVDDNFIGHKPKAKALLREIIAWRQRRRARVSLITEASINLVDDPELLDLMVQAGFTKVFIGVETPAEESLVECAKVQNTKRDLVDSIRTIQQAGMEVMGGFIVGFDNDTTDIFERQWRFIQKAGVTTAMVGLLTALPRTRLFTRLQEEGRLLAESTGNNLDAVLNFVPRMDRDALVQGYRRLVQSLYDPKTYYGRALTFLRSYKPRGPRGRISMSDFRAFVRSLWVLGLWSRGRRAFWMYFTRTLLFHPRAFARAMDLAITGHHFRKVAASI